MPPPLRLHRLQATGTVGWADQVSLLNPRFEPRLRHEDAAGHSALTLRKVRAVIELRHVTFPPGLNRGVGTPIEKAGALFW